jgi:hypothetical protein
VERLACCHSATHTHTHTHNVKGFTNGQRTTAPPLHTYTHTYTHTHTHARTHTHTHIHTQCERVRKWSTKNSANPTPKDRKRERERDSRHTPAQRERARQRDSERARVCVCISVNHSPAWLDIRVCTVSRELLTKADAKTLDKKANLESVVSGLGAQQEALKGVSTAFSQVYTRTRTHRRNENVVLSCEHECIYETKLISEARSRSRRSFRACSAWRRKLIIWHLSTKLRASSMFVCGKCPHIRKNWREKHP